MQQFIKTLRSRDFWLRQFLPFALAVAAAFIARYCLEAIRAALAGMTEALLREFAPEYGELPLLYAGGVMASSVIRERMERDFGGVFAEPQFSSDNAAGTAILAALAHERGGV